MKIEDIFSPIAASKALSSVKNVDPGPEEFFLSNQLTYWVKMDFK